MDLADNTHVFARWLYALVRNILYLWVFGDNIEEELGHRAFLLFYFLSGLGAAATHLVVNPDSVIPMVGASGAVSGVMGAYLVFHPKVTISLYVGCTEYRCPHGYFFRSGYSCN